MAEGMGCGKEQRAEGALRLRSVPRDLRLKVKA
jgi:hypothetical protein